MANVPGAAAGTYVNDPTKFYSDNANGCRSASNPNITSINNIFQSIGYSLSSARLLPATCWKRATKLVLDRFPIILVRNSRESGNPGASGITVTPCSSQGQAWTPAFAGATRADAT
jgi:hypothetical protein